MMPANTIFTTQMKPDSMPAKLQVNIKITKGKNVSMEVLQIRKGSQDKIFLFQPFFFFH